MMEKFYIDRQFGLPIWIDVDKGIVQRCYGEKEKYNAKMNENYKGKSITFLREDFIGRAMAGTYHHLRADSITSYIQIVEGFKSRVRNKNGQIASLGRRGFSTTDPKKMKRAEELHEENEKRILELKHTRADLEVEQYKAEKILEIEKGRILTEHNFQS